MAESDDVEDFMAALNSSLKGDEFRRLSLGKYRGRTEGLRQVQVRPLKTNQTAIWSARIRYRTRDITENLGREEIETRFRAWLREGFRSAHLHTATEDLQLEFNKRGKSRLSRSGPTMASAELVGHDREKRRLVSMDRPYLRALGITSEQGKVLPSRNDKWKQVNRFVEVFEAAFRSSPLAAAEELSVLDFGSGKGYLTFALHDHLRQSIGDAVTTTGVELRPELADRSNAAAQTCKCEGLSFEPGDIAGYQATAIDVMVALHACDTATDLALYQGIQQGAGLIMCAPCCHQEIRPQIRVPNVLEPMLRHGIHLGTEADTITDSLRALLLELSGYRVKVFEFISLEHTSKNKMIVATRHEPSDRESAREKYRKLRDFYGIRSQKLAELLGIQ